MKMGQCVWQMQRFYTLHFCCYSYLNNPKAAALGLLVKEASIYNTIENSQALIPLNRHSLLQSAFAVQPTSFL